MIEFTTIGDLELRGSCEYELRAVLLDVALGVEVFQVIPTLRAKFPNCRVLLFSNTVGDWILAEGTLSGVVGYVHEFDLLSELFAALEATIRGSVYHSPESVARRAIRSSVGDLTRRESAVLKLVCRGLSDESIAAALKIAPTTVETHRAALLRKLRLPDYAALLLFGLYSGLSKVGEIDIWTRVRRAARQHRSQR